MIDTATTADLTIREAVETPAAPSDAAGMKILNTLIRAADAYGACNHEIEKLESIRSIDELVAHEDFSYWINWIFQRRPYMLPEDVRHLHKMDACYGGQAFEEAFADWLKNAK